MTTERTRFVILNKKLQKIDITKVIKALQFYADPDNHDDICEDNGKQARSVLFKLGVQR